MLKKSRFAALLLACAVGIASAVPTFAEEAVAEDEKAPYYTHTYPESVKIGESVSGEITIHNLTPGALLGSLGWNAVSTVRADSNENIPAFRVHKGDLSDAIEVTENGDMTYQSLLLSKYYEAFLAPGKIYVDVGYYYIENPDGSEGDYENISVGDPIVIEVGAPVIETNAPKSIQVGDKLQFTTELTNTALTNKELALYIDESGNLIRETHDVVYQPSVEIIEGQDLVKQSNQDYSNTLKSSEELTFTGTGTVKLKAIYNQLKTCTVCQKNDNDLYNPEEIITIEVTDSSSEPSEPSKDEVKYETAEGITIEGDGVFPEGTVVKAEAVTSGDLFDTAKTALSNIAEKISVFDINAFNGETALQPGGNVKVTFDVPDDFSDNVSLYYVSDSGTAEKIESSFDKESRALTAELKHFSVYVLADEETKPADNTTDEGAKPADGNPGTGVVFSLYPFLAAAGVSGAVFAVLRKKRS